MGIRGIYVFVSVSLLFCLSGSAFAEQTLKDNLAKRYSQEKDICPVVKNAIYEGLNTKDITKSCIELGHDACLVIRCGIEAKGNLRQIILGAIEAGTTSDVCAKCAMDAGAKAGDIAKILEEGLGYSPAGGEGLTPIEVSVPGGPPSDVVSSSSFKK